MSRLEHVLWVAIYLLLMTFLCLSYARSQDVILERVVPRGCLLSVQLDDPSKCHVESIELAPDSECRAPIGQPLKCTHFAIALNKECHLKVTKRTDCENTNVKKVPKRSEVQ